MSTRPLPEPAAARRSSLLIGGLMLLCLVLAGIELALVGRNRELRAQVTELQRPRLPALEGRLFPALELIGERGDVFSLTEVADTHATLLFVSSPACDYCELARPHWERVAAGLAGTPLRVAELVLEPESGDDTSHAAFAPRLTAGPAEELLLRELPGLPAALLIDARGVVLHATFGAEQPGLARWVEEHLARVR